MALVAIVLIGWPAMLASLGLMTWSLGRTSENRVGSCGAGNSVSPLLTGRSDIETELDREERISL